MCPGKVSNAMKYVKVIGFVVVVALIAAGIYLVVHSQSKAPENNNQGRPPPVVRVERPVIRDIVNYDEFSGHLRAVDSVEIRARVEGYLRSIEFTDGAFVKKGGLLFEIEPELYKAERDRAAAALKSAQADLERAEKDYERVRQAVKADAVSKQEVTTYKAKRDMAEAAVLSAKATLDKAKLNLSYTAITSPVDGKLGRHLVDIGNLVGAGEKTILTSVVKLDPIHAYFTASERVYLSYMKNVRKDMADEPDKLPVFISLANGEEYGQEGRLDFMDNKVDPATGTIQLRGVIPNPDSRLYPGMFVRIRIPSKKVSDAVLIPQKAILTDLGGKYVLAVDENNVLKRCNLTLGAEKGKLQVATKGLAGNETIATGSLHIIRPGMPITPKTGDENTPKSPPDASSNIQNSKENKSDETS